MTIHAWLQRRLARVLPSIFLAPSEPILTSLPPLVHPDHPQRIDGVMYFNRGNRTDAELRAFILKTFEDVANNAPPGGAS